ncbi:MAG: helix-turn-helix domain-containing protein [Oscillospiraceae bacterium]|nr:helix-turn-helix domain-containing protein [Oscillospiraceae bacterium]
MMTKQAELKQQAYASNLKSRALSVLIYLIDRSNKDLTCFPAVPTMAEQLHISVSTVKRALKELIDAGYIRKEARFREKNRGQSSNLYTLLFTEQTPKPDKKNSTAKSGGNHIDTSQEKKQAKDHTIEYITFSTISEKEKSDYSTRPSKIRQENEPESILSVNGRFLRSVGCTPVHNAKLSGRIEPRIVTDSSRALCPAQPFSSLFLQWTGAESSLQPP